MNHLETLKRLELPAGDYAVFGSGPLFVRGIIDSVSDVDIICRGDAWDRVKEVGELHYLEKYDVEVVELEGGRISFGTIWGIGNFDIDELIDSAEFIDGLPFVRLKYVAEYKRIANREKDVEHLLALAEWQRAVGEV